MMNYAGKDPLPAITIKEIDKSQYRLKERDIQHIRIKDSSDLQATYDIKEKIGEGAFGVVLSIVEKANGKKWAMKTLLKTMAGWRLKLFQREIQILKTIAHPHIIYLDRIYESPKKIYIIFEKCCGSLANAYKEERVFSEKVARKILQELVEAVVYLHKYDIVHRDIKMENILLGENPNDPQDEYYVKLTDFGLSIVKNGAGFDGMLHEYCGTLTYMSPEIITKNAYSQQCDMWAIGVMLYMMVFGRYPFYSRNEKELQNQIKYSDPKFTDTNISVEVIDLLRLLLMKNPANRITAPEILNHPWMVNQQISAKVMPNNILQMMKEWKSEMTVPSGKESDWAVSQEDFITKHVVKSSATVVNGNKQPLALPVTDLKFERPSRRSEDLTQRATSSRARSSSNGTKLKCNPIASSNVCTFEHRSPQKSKD